MTLSLTWKVSSCVFLFLLVSFFPLPPIIIFLFCHFSFPILVPFLLLYFGFPASPCSCGVCPSHPSSVPSVCPNCRFQFYSFFPPEAPGGAGGSSLCPLGVPRAGDDVPSLVFGSVSSVSPVLVPCCHWGGFCVLVFEKLQLQEPPRHLFLSSRWGSCPSWHRVVPGAQRPPQGLTGGGNAPPATVVLQNKRGSGPRSRCQGDVPWRLGCCTENQVFCDKIREIGVIEMLDETASERFHPIRSQDPSLAGWFGLGFYFIFYFFFLMLGRERCEAPADKCEESQMLLLLGDVRAGTVPSQGWSLWCGICHNLYQRGCGCFPG